MPLSNWIQFSLFQAYKSERSQKTAGRRLFFGLSIVAMILGSVLGLAYGLYSLGNKNLKSQGNLVVNGDFGIYSDPQTSHSLTSLQFGNISLGNNYLITYIRNQGTVNITLEISSIGLNSSSNGVTLSNNYEGAVIKPGAAVQIQWDMNVTNQFAPAGTYNFDITISSVRA